MGHVEPWMILPT